MNFAGAGTLFNKEVLRFWKVSVQTVAAPGRPKSSYAPSGGRAPYSARGGRT